MSERLDNLKERLQNLKSFKANELKLPKEKQSANYIADLIESIKSCNKQIVDLVKNGDKIEVMNGGEFV